MIKKSYAGDFLLTEVIGAIQDGNKEDAIQKAKTLFYNTKNMHDGLLDMFSLALNFIAEDKGEDGIGAVWRYIGEKKWSVAEGFKSGKLTYEDYKEYIRLGEMAHYSNFTAEEDDEKIVFSMHDCGVCGRMVKEGKLDTSDKNSLNFGAIKEPHDWTLGYTGMPYYCIHAPYFFNILGKEKGYDAFDFVWGRQFDEEGNPVDEPCKEIVYKIPRTL